MKVMRLSDTRPVRLLVEDDAPRPQPGRGELLVQVYAVGVTPTELVWYTTTHNRDGGKRSGAVPGHEFCGVVAAGRGPPASWSAKSCTV